jgi:predicted lipid-binding transport protein (Tim44 family)/uncharacterized tellurite resistance protein B-like protein
MKELYSRLKLYRISRRILPLIVLLTLCVSAAELYARAGGGGGFSGGGGGGFSGGGGSFGGGSGGGGGGGIEIIFWLIMLAFQHPVIGIPALIIVGVLFTVGSLQSKRGVQTYHQSRSIYKHNKRISSMTEQQNIEKIQKQDPDFSKELFFERVKTGFMKLQDAWCAQDLSKVRSFISDGISERFQLQFMEQKERGVRDKMENIQILAVAISQTEFDKVFNTLTIRITASAIDYMVDIETGKHKSGSRAVERFTEYWTFIRRPGVHTIPGKGLIEGHCPNCGVLLDINESAKCESCGSLIKSGEYDWVLSEITQACEWVPQAKNRLPGIDKIRETDPGFSPQQLEDRASVMFWRNMTAYRQGKIAPIRKMATDKFCDTLKEHFKPDEDGNRVYPAQCAVGSVETLGIEVTEPMDRALVKIRWSGKKESLSKDGRKRILTDSNISTHIFMLIRKHGVSTGDSGLSSAHCPGCGAPVSSELADACQYCGTVLNDGSHDWVLDAVELSYDQEVQECMNAIEAQEDSEEIVERPGVEKPTALIAAAWMIKTMLADKVIDAKERVLLNRYASDHNIPMATLESLIEGAKNKTLKIPEPENKEEARNWISLMAKMALSDGFISPQEKQLLTKLGNELNYTNYDIKQIIAAERRKLYQELKDR